MPHAALVCIDNASTEHRAAILKRLAEFNAAHAEPANHAPLCIAVVDRDGAIEGGLYGATVYDWLVIELLIVPEEMRGRGLGRDLVARAEEEARARGCIGAWLDTFDFQARGFYEKLGYRVAGAIPDHPRGGARYFLMKRWSGTA